jgi:hypothetical protein
MPGSSSWMPYAPQGVKGFDDDDDDDEGPLPHSQVPAICPYPETARSNPYPYIFFERGHPIVHLQMFIDLVPSIRNICKDQMY